MTRPDDTCVCSHERINHFVRIISDDGTAYRGGCERCNDCDGFKPVQEATS